MSTKLAADPDEQLLGEIRRVQEANDGADGARKVHAQLRREGIQVGRCTVERLMRAAGQRGISRAKGPRTTVPDRGADSREDLVQCEFAAAAPNQLWVADITYCRAFAGWVYAAFIIDVFSRRVLGWQLSTSFRTDLAEADAVASVGSTGESYDNALAEAFNSLFKAELIRNRGPFKSIEDLEVAVAGYSAWFNHRRVHGEI